METQRNTGDRWLMVTASVIVVVAGLRQAGQLVLPFLTAGILAVASFPVMAWLQHRQVPTSLAVLIIVAIAGGLVSVLGLGVGRSINEFAQVVPEYQARFQELANEISGWADGVGLSASDWTPLDYVNPETIVNLIVTVQGVRRFGRSDATG